MCARPSAADPVRAFRFVVLLLICLTGGFLTGRALWLVPPAAPPPPVDAPKRPTRMPAFELENLASGERQSSSAFTSRGLILNFWATWCTPCRKEMPLLEQVHQQGRSAVGIVGVAIDRTEPARLFLAETGISYPNLVGEADAMDAAQSFGPDFIGLPMTVVSAPGGEILDIHTGELRPDHLERYVAVLEHLAAGHLSAAAAREQLRSATKQAKEQKPASF